MAKATSFEDLEIWKKSIDLAFDFYALIKNGPVSKDYPFCDQIKRAAISVSNNISEGFEYGSNKQFVKFLFIAKGSLGELRNMLYLMDRFGYIDKDLFLIHKDKCTELAKMISSLIKYLEKHINN
ncbi:MAG: four helix bundle protein [Bacteroidales bacterium]